MDFPTIKAIQPTHGGGRDGQFEDAFIMVLSSTGDEILYSTYFGGRGNDFGWRLNFDNSGRLYLTGFSDSTNLLNNGSLDSNANGGVDLYIATFELNEPGSAINANTAGFDLSASVIILGLIAIFYLRRKK